MAIMRGSSSRGGILLPFGRHLNIDISGGMWRGCRWRLGVAGGGMFVAGVAVWAWQRLNVNDIGG